MSDSKKFIYSIDELDTVVDYLADQTQRCAVFAFNGPLGAGKTTLIKQLLRKNSVEGVITSPTFTYVNVYQNPKKQTFYHFDLYRIVSLDDFLEAGFGEYLYQDQSWSFIEWPATIKPLLQQRTCYINIDYYGDAQRILTCAIDSED